MEPQYCGTRLIDDVAPPDVYPRASCRASAADPQRLLERLCSIAQPVAGAVSLGPTARGRHAMAPRVTRYLISRLNVIAWRRCRHWPISEAIIQQTAWRTLTARPSGDHSKRGERDGDIGRAALRAYQGTVAVVVRTPEVPAELVIRATSMRAASCARVPAWLVMRADEAGMPADAMPVREVTLQRDPQSRSALPSTSVAVYPPERVAHRPALVRSRVLDPRRDSRPLALHLSGAIAFTASAPRRRNPGSQLSSRGCGVQHQDFDARRRGRAGPLPRPSDVAASVYLDPQPIQLVRGLTAVAISYRLAP